MILKISSIIDLHIELNVGRVKVVDIESPIRQNIQPPFLHYLYARIIDLNQGIIKISIDRCLVILFPKTYIQLLN